MLAAEVLLANRLWPANSFNRRYRRLDFDSTRGQEVEQPAGAFLMVRRDVLEKMNCVILTTALIVGYAYGIELFIAWYSGNPYESFAFVNRAMGPYAWAYWTMVSCNVFVPQLFWWRRLRRSIPVMLSVAVLVNVGMWFERFVIIVTALQRDYLPSSWGYFQPTVFDFLTFIGSVGLFFTLILLFVRFLPIVAMSEVKGAMKHEFEA